MLYIYLDKSFNELHATTGNRHADGSDIKLDSFSPFASFSSYELTTISEKHSEKISHAHIVSLMYKLITSDKNTVDLSVGSDRDRGRRQRELTNNKDQKGKYHVRIMLRDLFAFAKHLEKAICSFRCKLTLTKNSDNSFLNNANSTKNFKIKSNGVE